MALTIKEIDKAKPSDKPYKLSDGGGRCLLVTPSGARLWRWRYRFEGKEKMMALGEYPLVPLSQARDLHVAARKTLAAESLYLLVIIGFAVQRSEAPTVLQV
jgi:hypothetical protein